jgi:hypothetical protein
LTIGLLGVAAALLALSAAAPERAHASRAAVGVFLSHFEEDPAVVDQYIDEVGSAPAIIHVYKDWEAAPFDPAVLGTIAARGAVPLVTWEPWRNWSEPVSLRAIASGAEDGLIAAAAREAAAWHRPFFLRFAHEMNGGWYPWGRGVNGNTPQVYKAAWRHVVDVFRANGATNARWVWTPYLDAGGRPFKRFYPGDRWVDWAGLDGFNWGSRFVSFAKLFAESYREIVKMTDRPLMVAETGSVEYGGNKAAWVSATLDKALPRFRHIRAIVWWSGIHTEKGTDVRIDTSPEAVLALRDALQAPQLNPGRRFLLERPGWLRRRR